jgi:uncharacterized RDD family membrane protein YckC
LDERNASAHPTQGVYYARGDYAGFWRRLMVDAIDFTLLLVVVVTTALSLVLILPNGERLLLHVLFWSGIAFGFVYLVLLKHSRFRTLGYLVGGIRIVSIQGQRPSIWSLTIRALFAFFGPLNMLVDIMWVTSDERRQALRDKFAHTYVIRDRAIPMGLGAIVYARYTILGANFLFAEVRPIRSAAP